VNTGISGFVDPLGRTSNLLDARTSGSSCTMLLLDSRVTVFTRVGQLFSKLCAAVTLLAVAGSFAARGVSKSGLS
jgi:apolipoprotein N-acyltransferase